MILEFISCIILMAIAHEVGHYYAIRNFRIPAKDIKISLFKDGLICISYPDILTREQKGLIIIIGVLSGIVPLPFFSFSTIGNIMLITIYSCFITRDIKEFKKLGFKFKLED